MLPFLMDLEQQTAEYTLACRCTGSGKFQLIIIILHVVSTLNSEASRDIDWHCDGLSTGAKDHRMMSSRILAQWSQNKALNLTNFQFCA